MQQASHPKTFQCPKCSSTEFKQDMVRMTGSGLSRFFNIQNRKYEAISCLQCGYTELYSRKTSTAGNIADFLLGG